MYSIQVDEDEIDDVLNAAIINVDNGTTLFSGESYEAGILALWRWLTGETDKNPMEE